MLSAGCSSDASESTSTPDTDTRAVETANTAPPEPSDTPEVRIAELQSRLLEIEGIYVIDTIEVYDTTPPDDILFSYDIFVEPGYVTDAMAERIMETSISYWEQHVTDLNNIEWSFSFSLWDGSGPAISYSCCGSPGIETGLVRDELMFTPVITSTPE